MNNRGQGILLGIVIGLGIFMAGALLINFLELERDVTLGATSLDCDNSDISDGTKAACLLVEITIPYFIIILLSVVGGTIGGKFLK